MSARICSDCEKLTRYLTKERCDTCYHRYYLHTNPEYRKRQSIKNKSYLYRNREKLIAQRRRRYRDARQVVLNHYGNKCGCCGESIKEFLAIDHINNDGNKLRKKESRDRWFWIIRNNFPDNLQILCHNCNCAKAFYGLCPHKYNESIEVQQIVG